MSASRFRLADNAWARANTPRRRTATGALLLATLLPLLGLVASPGCDEAGLTIPSPAPTPLTTSTMTLTTGRFYHQAIPLADGRVLIVGGAINALLSPTVTCEIIDPFAQTVVQTGSLIAGRNVVATGLLLAETDANAEYVLIGGKERPEIYSTASELWTAVTAWDAAYTPDGVADWTGRGALHFTQLDPGEILVTHGDDVGSPFGDGVCLLFAYDPADPLNAAAHTVTRLVNTTSPGRKSAERRDTVRLPSGEVLMIGPGYGFLEAEYLKFKGTAQEPVGWDTTRDDARLNAVEIVTPAVGPDWVNSTFAAPGPALPPSHLHRSAGWALPVQVGGGDWDAIIFGGEDIFGNLISTTERYDSSAGTYVDAGDMNVPRRDFTAAVLNRPNDPKDGRQVYVFGGVDEFSNPIGTVERYDADTDTWAIAGNLDVPVALATACATQDGHFLITGGIDTAATVRDIVQVFRPPALTTMSDPRADLAAAPLPSGAWLVGGGSQLGTWDWFVFDSITPAASAFFPTRDSKYRRQRASGMVATGDGRVLAVGSPPEVYSPDTGFWTEVTASAGNGWNTRSGVQALKLDNVSTATVRAQIFCAFGDAFNQPFGDGDAYLFLYDETNAASAFGWSVRRVPLPAPGRRTQYNSNNVVLLDNDKLLVVGAGYGFYDTEWHSATTPTTDAEHQTALDSAAILITPGVGFDLAAATTANVTWPVAPDQVRSDAWLERFTDGNALIFGGYEWDDSVSRVPTTVSILFNGGTETLGVDADMGALWRDKFACAQRTGGSGPNDLYIFGGTDSTGALTNAISIYDYSAGTWISHPTATLATPRMQSKAIYIASDDLFIVFGGLDAATAGSPLNTYEVIAAVP